MADVHDDSVPLTSHPVRTLTQSSSGGLAFVEFSATKWIAAVWAISFMIACLAAQTTRSFAMESFQIAMSCLGILLIVVWYGLYGNLGWARLLRFAVVVVVTCGVGGWLSKLSAASCGEMVMITLLATSIGLAYFYLARRLLGWEIVHPLRMTCQSSTGQFSIAESMIWMLYFSLFTVLANQVRIDSFNSRIAEFAFFVFLGILFPVGVSFVGLWLVARHPFKVLAWLIPCIALAIATVLSASFYFFAGASREEAINWFFWPNLIWFSVTGLSVALAAGELRRHGFVLAFSKAGYTAPPGDLVAYQRTNLEDRIRYVMSWQQVLQKCYEWVQTRLAARKSSLEAELASLPQQREDETSAEL